MTATFTKPAQATSDLIAQLRARGLRIRHDADAAQALETIGYYRLSGYTLLLETAGVRATVAPHRYVRSHVFQAGATFEKVLALYEFDRRLRSLTLDAVLRLEIAIRTVITNHMALTHSDPHWYLNQAHFSTRYTTPAAGKSKSNYSVLLEEVERETGKFQSKRRTAFTDYYYQEFGTPPLPPCWMIAEQVSFGTWSVLYSNLASSRDRKDIAATFNVSPNELESWIRALSYLRNLCAHQARLIGVNFVTLPMTSTKLPPLAARADYVRFAAVLHYLLRSAEPGYAWAAQLKALMRDARGVDKSGLLGFEPRWSQHAFWRL